MDHDTPLPTGLSIGPMRTGSTWLYEYLLSRGDVCLPYGVKETFYFAENHGRGAAWYAEHFRHYDARRHRRILEVSPTLFQNPDAPARVRATLARPVVLATLRRPIDRAWSHYMHLRQYGATSLGFDAAVRRLPSLVDASLYARHLARWRDTFGPEAVHVVFYRDLKERRARYVRQVDATFDLPPVPVDATPPGRVNQGSLPRNVLLARAGHLAAASLRRSGLHRLVNAGKRVGLSNLVYGRSRTVASSPAMQPATRRYLIDRFAPDVAELERLLDIDLDPWREKWHAARRESSHA